MNRCHDRHRCGRRNPKLISGNKSVDFFYFTIITRGTSELKKKEMDQGNMGVVLGYLNWHHNCDGLLN